MAKASPFAFLFMFFIALTPVIAIETPRFLAFWPLILGLIFSLLHILKDKEKFIIPKSYILVAGGISVLSLISCVWSIAPQDALKEALKISAILGFGTLWIGYCHSVRTENIKNYAFFIPIAVLVSCIIILFEMNFDMALYKIVRGLPSDSKIASAEMNRGVVSCILMLFITIGYLLSAPNLTKKRKLFWFLIASPLVIGILIQTESQSAHLIFISGLPFLFFAVQSKRLFSFLAVIFGITIALTPLIVDFLYDWFMTVGHDTPWFSSAYAGNRVEIWRFITLYAMNNPLFGYGVEATYFVDHFSHPQIYHWDDTVLHPHNFAVQVWMEYGAIGALIYTGFIYVTLEAIAGTPLFARRYILATFIGVIAISSVAYGMWQSWWIGYVIFLTGLCVLLGRLR